jgi:hypothetical protein
MISLPNTRQLSSSRYIKIQQTYSTSPLKVKYLNVSQSGRQTEDGGYEASFQLAGV